MTVTPTDEELVHATLAGNQASFALLVHRYRRAALARAVAIVGDPAEAEDVAQESFIHGYAELATCRHPARFGAWLLTSVKRRALNRVRSIRRRRAVGLDDSIQAPADSADDLDRRELRDRLRQALAQLSAVQREVVLLADLEQWSHAEIAAGVMGRIATNPDPYPVPVGVVWGMASMVTPVAVAATVILALAATLMLRSGPSGPPVPETVAESIGVPDLFRGAPTASAISKVEDRR